MGFTYGHVYQDGPALKLRESKWNTFLGRELCPTHCPGPSWNGNENILSSLTRTCLGCSARPVPCVWAGRQGLSAPSGLRHVILPWILPNPGLEGEVVGTAGLTASSLPLDSGTRHQKGRKVIVKPFRRGQHGVRRGDAAGLQDWI